MISTPDHISEVRPNLSLYHTTNRIVPNRPLPSLTVFIVKSANLTENEIWYSTVRFVTV